MQRLKVLQCSLNTRRKWHHERNRVLQCLCCKRWDRYKLCRSSHPEVFLRKGVLKICSKFRGEYACRGVISIKLQINFIEIALRHVYSPVNLLHIFRTPFPRNTSGWLLFTLLAICCFQSWKRYEIILPFL